MGYMNMILIGTLKDNINFDILSRNRFLIYYFVLFLLHQSLMLMLKCTIFRQFWSVRNEDDDTAVKLLRRVQIGSIKGISTVASNFKALFYHLAGRIVLIFSCVHDLFFCRNVSLQPSICMHILPRWYLPLVHGLSLPPTIHMLYFVLSKLSNLEIAIFESSNFTFFHLVSYCTIFPLNLPGWTLKNSILIKPGKH